MVVKRRAMVDNPWDDDLVEGTREDIPRIGRVFRSAKAQRRFLKTLVYGGPVLLLIVSVALMSVLDRPVGARHVTSELSDARRQGRAVAMEAVRTWLGRDPAPLPHAHLVSWDGVERAKDLGGAEKGDRRKDKDWPIDVHTLTVASASGQIFRTQVAVAMTDAGPVVAADPSLTPYAPVDTSEAESSWQGAIPVSSLDGEDMALAARSWAEALYSGDGGRLRQAVGDADKSRAYVPMPAASAVVVKVRNVSALHRVEDGDVPSRVIARVSVTPTWGQARPDGQGKAASVAYDVLIVGANTASPRVVAWGGAGSGPSLKPYANAVTGIDLPTPSPTQSDQASPSVTPSAPAEPGPSEPAESTEPTGKAGDE